MSEYKQIIEQLAKDYDTACANYCRYMVAMWQAKVFNDYLADDYYHFSMNGIDYALCIEDVRFIVNNKISANKVKQWHKHNLQADVPCYTLQYWMNKNDL